MNQKLLWWFCLFSLIMVSIGMMLLVTRQGIGLFTDDLVYFPVARTFDFFTFSTHPPLYGIILGGVGKIMGSEPESSAVLLNVVLMPLNVLIMVLIVRMLRPDRRWLSLGAGGLVLFSYPFVYVHAMASSEPLFLVLVSTSLLLLAMVTIRFHWSFLLGSAVLTGLAVLTRYAGAALVMYCGFLLLWVPAKSLRVRVLRAGLFCIISTAPVFVFFVLKNVRNTGAAITARSVGMLSLYEHMGHVVSVKIPQLFVTFSEWFVPYRVLEYIGVNTVGILLILIVCGVLFWNCFRKSMTNRMGLICFCFWPAFYLLFVLSWMCLSGELEIAMSHRILSPVAFWIVPFLLVAVCDITSSWRYGHSAICATLFAFIFFVSFYRAFGFVRFVGSNGLGLGALAWRYSPTLAYAISNVDECIIYSNAEEVFLLYHPDVRVHVLPKRRCITQGRTIRIWICK